MDEVRTDRREYPLKMSRKAVFLLYAALSLGGAVFWVRLASNPIAPGFCVGSNGWPGSFLFVNRFPSRCVLG